MKGLTYFFVHTTCDILKKDDISHINSYEIKV